MLTKIEEREIMTSWDASLKYRDKYFKFVITEVVDGGDKDLGYVAYTYDCLREMRGIDRGEFEGLRVGSYLGVAAEKGLSVGGLEGIGSVIFYDTNH
ncbi:MAG: hypothetical protein FWB74_09780 [Defluviitaleaceae bacterium]|nr:hypothetical protein [Defluviitaleaceae bacterium]